MIALRHQLGSRSGFTLVEVIVVIFVSTVLLLGMFTSIRYSIFLIDNTRAKTGALSLANERMEYIRSLAYADVGTVAGFPIGAIPQNRTVTLNGVAYEERVLIEFVDAPEDGLGAADTNGVITDYKQVKVELRWQVRGENNSVSLVSNIVPRTIETPSGGGILRANVFDAVIQPVENANVRVFNDTGTSTYDVTQQTDSAGIATFIVPANTNYEVYISKSGYSQDQTYYATTSNPNPTTRPLTVLENDITTADFQIDELSSMNLAVYDSWVFGEDQLVFDDFTAIATSSNIEIVADEIRLASSSGTYVSTGHFFTTSISPSPLSSWDSLLFIATSTPATNITFQLYSATGTPPSTFTLIPDSVVPGNAAGLDTRAFLLDMIPVDEYQDLVVRVNLTTLNVNQTPTISDLFVRHVQSSSTAGSIDTILTGTRSIGTTAGGVPVIKNTISTTTNSNGQIQFTNIDWDQYEISLSSGASDIAKVCVANPFSLEPGIDNLLMKLLLVPNQANSLRVEVTDASGTPIPYAEVELTRNSFRISASTDSCGQVFFNTGLATETDYVITVTAPDYTDQVISDVEIDGDVVEYIQLNP